MNTANPRVLFAPAHYFTGANVGGSEYQWMFELVSAMAQSLGDSSLVTGELRNGMLPRNITVQEVWKKKVDFDKVAPRLEFMAAYYLYCLGLKRRTRHDIHHHLLPWGTETFDPLILLRGTPLGDPRAVRTVLGPIQTPPELPTTESDMGDVLNRSFSPAERSEQPSRPPRASKGSPLLPLARALSKATLDRTDHLIAITPAAKEMLIAMGVERPVTVIPAGVSAANFPFVPRPNAQRPIRLLSTCYLVRRKAVDVTIRAMSLLRERNVAAELTIVGDGPERGVLERQVKAAALHDVIRFAGFVENSEIFPYYASSDAWISMSRAESFGVSMLEAMSTGMAIISSANVGARAIVADKTCGILVPVGDHHALAEAIERLARNFAACREMGESARRRVLEAFDWRIIARQYLEVYSALLNPT